LTVQVVGRDDLRPGIDEGLIGDERAVACSGFDEDFEPGGRELAERFGYQGDAPLPWRRRPSWAPPEKRFELTGMLPNGAKDSRPWSADVPP
jgi:hypothetical protein